MWPGEDLGSLDGKPSQTRRDHWWGLPFPCPGAPTGSKSPRFASSASESGEMLLRKCWLGTLSLFGTMPGVGKKQWNCPVEERKVLWKASLMLLCGSLDKGKSISSSFQGLLETVLLQDRNTFVDTNIRQRYEIEMAHSSPPLWDFRSVSLCRGCAFVYNYFFFCILILFSFPWMHCNYISLWRVWGVNCQCCTMARLYQTRKERAPVLGEGWQLQVLIQTCGTATLQSGSD